MGRKKPSKPNIGAEAKTPPGQAPTPYPASPRLCCFVTVIVPGRTIGQQLQYVRTAKGWDVPEAGKKLGVDSRLLYQLEQDLEKPSPRVMKRIQDGYKVSITILGNVEGTKIPKITQ